MTWAGLSTREAGPCPVCGLLECRQDYRPFGAPGPMEPMTGRSYTPPEHVWRDGRLAFAAGDPIPWERAVREGLVTDEPVTDDPKPRGKRGSARARRPSEDRMKRPSEDR